MTDQPSTSAAPVYPQLSRHIRGLGWAALAAVALLGLAAAIAYACFDQAAVDWCRVHTYPWHVSLWVRAFKLLGKTWPVALILLAWGLATRRWHPAAIGLLALFLTIVVFPAKQIVGRPRPQHPEEDHATQTKPRLLQSFSFPSGDAATVFATSAALAPFVGLTWGAALFALSAAISAMRVLSLYHYPSDVLAGAALGILCGWAALSIGRFIGRRWLSRAPPVRH